MCFANATLDCVGITSEIDGMRQGTNSFLFYFCSGEVNNTQMWNAVEFGVMFCPGLNALEKEDFSASKMFPALS